MSTKITLLLTCLFIFGRMNGQSGKLTLEEKIKQDMILMDKMIKNLERGTENIEKLKEIDDKIRQIWSGSQDAILIGERPFTEHIYGETKDAIEEFLPDDAARLVEDIKELKLRYSQINGDKNKYKKERKIFEDLKKQYKRKGISFGKKLKALLKIRRFMNKELDNESTDITGMLTKGGELLTIVDEYAVEMGMETLSEKDLEMLKDDPLEFLVKKAQKHLNNYKRGKEEYEYFKKEKDKQKDSLHILTDSLFNINKLHNLTQTKNKKLSEENEAIAANSKKEQQKLQQELNNLKDQLTKQQQLVQSLKNERNTISKEVNQLSNQRIMIVKDVDDKANEKQALSEATQALEDTINDKANLLLATKQDLTATKDALKLKQATLESLAEERDTAEQERMMFLFSSIVMLLAILSMLGYEYWHTKKVHKEEREKLEESLILTEEFYTEYRETDKSELAIQREKLKLLLRELNHRLRDNLQMLSSMINICVDTDDEKVTEVVSKFQKRIHALGVVYNDMYDNDFDKQIPIRSGKLIDQYIRNLENSLLDQQTIIKKDIDELTMLPDNAVAFGLIVNEVLSNCFKHAFVNNAQPTLHISVKCKQKNVCVTIKDNGKGMTNGCLHKDSMGLKIIALCTRRLGGDYKFENNDGLIFKLDFILSDAQIA